MKREFEHLSRSQFILTYGPGSIIETKNGPRLIPKLSTGLGEFFNSDIFQRFEIPDVRLCKYIQKSSTAENRCRIIALPSNAGLGKEQNFRVYSTLVFPVWKICYGREEGKRHPPVLYYQLECPFCKTTRNSGIVRFVSACPDGHLDEVDWQYSVHKNRLCKPEFYYWKTSGSSLTDIVIECPDCKAKTDMYEIYRLRLPCSARYPERERPKSKNSPYYSDPERPRDCNKEMRITQRQSSSLRIPETITLLTIPKYDNTLSRILQQSSVSTGLDVILSSPIDFSQMGVEKFLKWIKDGLSGRVSAEALDIIECEIKSTGIEQFLDLYTHLNSEENSFLDMMYEEFDSLLSGAGSPSDNFIMDNFEIARSDSSSPIPELNVYPIRKIRTITAQTGYRRMIAQPDKNETKKISTAVRLDQDYWYPGFEGFGEGLFITFNEMKFPEILNQDAYQRWLRHDSATIRNQTEWADICTLPEFVWLHTLSHALIRAVSEFTGYSAPSLRERVYLSRNQKNGGILIYNTAPGADGGMGGLTGVAKNFKPIIEKTSENICICSNDPLCSDLKKTDGNLNGSACYSCLMVSETSCEHRNLWLDRHLLLNPEK